MHIQINLVANNLANEAIESMSIGMLDNLADYAALAADGTDDGNLVSAESRLAAFLVPVLVLATNNFVHFDDFP